MKSKKVKQIENCKVIKIWDSVGEASRLGFNNSLIREVCIGKRKSHKGFQWEYVNDDDIKPKIGIKKPIICEYLNGKKLTFSSKKEASKFLNISETSIQNILLNRRKLNNNYKLYYKNE